MSGQFGRWNFDGQPAAPEYIASVRSILALYGPDGQETYSKGGLAILYHPFHTTKESHRETQPYVSQSGSVITWDGRLDNRKELIRELENFSPLSADSTDVAIVAAAYEEWGDRCFARLIGDWALSIWNPKEHCVLLARDLIGIRPLFYHFDKDHLAWSTSLGPLVQFSGKTFDVCEEYLAGWFAIPAFPAAHLTPFADVHAVPPSSFVYLRPGKHDVKHAVRKYWDFNPSKKIRYRTDGEYEEHFRTVLMEAVRRRLRSDRPVLGELSGGMDSTAIVCLADAVIAQGQAECPRLDTMSWFDDTYDHLEPDTNELHWLRKVEEKRGRAGFHLNLRELRAENADPHHRPFVFDYDNDRFAAAPIPNRKHADRLTEKIAAHMNSQGYRVRLSGIGGDEPTGGYVPTPTPELQNLLARGRFLTLVKQLNAWAARMKQPRFPLLWEAVRGFFSIPSQDAPVELLKTPWFRRNFVTQNYAAFCGYPARVKLFGPLPSFQDHMDKLEANRRFFSFCGAPTPELLDDTRYPYCDRDFLEFMYAIPREQIVGVGKRRFLMKRALTGIVPDEILNRRRINFAPPEISPKPEKDPLSDWPTPAEVGQSIFSSSVGIIHADRFLEGLEKARRKEAVSVQNLKVTLFLEYWLRHLAAHGILKNSALPGKLSSFPQKRETSPASVPAEKFG